MTRFWLAGLIFVCLCIAFTMPMVGCGGDSDDETTIVVTNTVVMQEQEEDPNPPEVTLASGSVDFGQFQDGAELASGQLEQAGTVVADVTWSLNGDPFAQPHRLTVGGLESVVDGNGSVTLTLDGQAGDAWQLMTLGQVAHYEFTVKLLTQ